MARLYLTLSILGLLIPVAAADAPSSEASTRERDAYFPAATYAVMRGSTPQACEAACQDDGQCRAWSLTPPTFRAGPKCELKSAAGRSVAKAAAVSGVLATSTSEAPQPAPEPESPEPQAANTPPQPAPRPDPRPQAQPPLSVPERPAASPAQPVTIEPYIPARPAPTPTADRPWPGLRRSSDNPPEVVYPEGNTPLPLRRSENVPSYSVQSLEALPGDVEDTGGLKGRLPSGQDDDAAEEATEDGAED